MSSSRGSSRPRDQTCISCIVGIFFKVELLESPKEGGKSCQASRNLRSSLQSFITAELRDLGLSVRYKCIACCIKNQRKFTSHPPITTIRTAIKIWAGIRNFFHQSFFTLQTVKWKKNIIKFPEKFWLGTDYSFIPLP